MRTLFALLSYLKLTIDFKVNITKLFHNNRVVCIFSILLLIFLFIKTDCNNNKDAPNNAGSTIKVASLSTTSIPDGGSITIHLSWSGFTANRSGLCEIFRTEGTTNIYIYSRTNIPVSSTNNDDYNFTVSTSDFNYAYIPGHTYYVRFSITDPGYEQTAPDDLSFTIGNFTGMQDFSIEYYYVYGGNCNDSRCLPDNVWGPVDYAYQEANVNLHHPNGYNALITDCSPINGETALHLYLYNNIQRWRDVNSGIGFLVGLDNITNVGSGDEVYGWGITRVTGNGGYPGAGCVFTTKINALPSGNGWDVNDRRKKLKWCLSIHELAHVRGLQDNHYGCGGDHLGYCAYLPSISSPPITDPGSIDNILNFIRFCGNHRQRLSIIHW